jgi:hypothetical protein
MIYLRRFARRRILARRVEEKLMTATLLFVTL